VTFDADHAYDLMVEEHGQRTEEAERALHEPRDDDRLARCPVCQAVPNVRCCEYAKDVA
jgi:hypothetical protein